MERQIETTEMTDGQLEAVSGGGVTTGFGVRTDQQITLQHQLTKAFASGNPYIYYGYFG